MKWVKTEVDGKKLNLPIKSWCQDIDDNALKQAADLANHPVIVKHVALMPDAHLGYGMPIGGVIACKNAVIPNAVGVDIGCGMGAIKTTAKVDQADKATLRKIIDLLKEVIPVGESCHKEEQEWIGFDNYIDNFVDSSTTGYFSALTPEWYTEKVWDRARKSLGTLGSGNHFCELTKDLDNNIWLMLHSGSRNLGYKIAEYYHGIAIALNEQWKSNIPCKDLAFLPADTKEGQNYIRDMNFALDYAKENRFRMMSAFKKIISEVLGCDFEDEINIHHNFARLENHFGDNLWIHRKGATAVHTGIKGIIPGSMGTSSYIVEGLGNKDSFKSCSHGAGRKMGRMQACRTLTIEDCDKAMEGLVFDRWTKLKTRKKNNKEKLYDLGESPLAYKDIEDVIDSQLDLIKPLVRLSPLGTLKG
jgi:tRNA-splicing ligase RtcB (3'-phosphate/5'-hydroxy nucleic acid ligase)